MQLVWAGVADRVCRLELPDPEDVVLPGVRWGSPDVPLTPAYWAVRCRWADGEEPFVRRNGSLVEEIAFCILGGFGITYEVNAAAFDRLKAAGVFEASEASENWILRELTHPLQVGSRSIRYRFPKQRARRLSRMLATVKDVSYSGLSPLQLRDVLLKLEGVGPKTASWVVRNLFGTDDVAILDVHILRACHAMDLFPDKFVLPRDYGKLESRFIHFAKAIDVRPSILDAVMWVEMRQGGARAS